MQWGKLTVDQKVEITAYKMDSVGFSAGNFVQNMEGCFEQMRQSEVGQLKEKGKQWIGIRIQEIIKRKNKEGLAN